MMTQKLENLVSSLTSIERDALYRYLWSEHVADDVAEYCESNGIRYNDELISAVVNLYVYQGEYDCTLSYWDNLSRLIRQAGESLSD